MIAYYICHIYERIIFFFRGGNYFVRFKSTSTKGLGVVSMKVQEIGIGSQDMAVDSLLCVECKIIGRARNKS